MEINSARRRTIERADNPAAATLPALPNDHVALQELPLEFMWD